jgi:triosephosphate isomerase
VRKSVVAGNWKMNLSLTEGVALVREIVSGLSSEKCDVILCPPFTHLSIVSELCKGSSVMVGAQTLHHEAKGAFTGEISGPMLQDCGCQYVLIGHSERRQYFHEDHALLFKKFQASFSHGLIPILCVGETLEERESGRTLDVVEAQLISALHDVGDRGFLVAYEPVWAIGTGKVATPEQAQEVHAFIRGTLNRLVGSRSADISILYGGSVTPQNSGELLGQPDIDGALVGGASLKSESFLEIVHSVK